MSRTLLIGLDGATFTVLDRLLAQGVMPNLRAIVARGVRASLRSIMPPLTPPGWTSMITGKRPGRHGVFDFFQKESPENQYFRLATARDIHSETVWSLASRQDRRVVVLNYPVTFPAPAVNGCIVPGGWMPWRQLRLGCYPSGLFDRLKSLPSFNPREMALDMELEEKAVEGCAAEEYAHWVELHIRRERRWLDIARYLVTEEDPDFLAIVFDGVDKIQHLCWRFLDPACWSDPSSEWELDMRRLCEGYFRELDIIIGELAAMAGPDGSVVLASDHGFGPASEVFYLNTWLERQGYLTWLPSAPVDAGDEARVGFSRIAHHLLELDWDKTVAYAATPSGQGIHLVTHDPNGRRILSTGEYERLREEIAGQLTTVRHPVTGERVVAEVWTSDRAFPGPYQALGPDISIIPTGGAGVSILRGDAIVKARLVTGGSHRWEGVFVAAGPGIRQGSELDELSIVDVAPTLLYLLDVPVPDDLDGRLPAEALDPRHLERQPLSLAAAGSVVEDVDAADGDLGLDPESEDLIVDRLRALGYVE